MPLGETDKFIGDNAWDILLNVSWINYNLLLIRILTALRSIIKYKFDVQEVGKKTALI